MSDKPQARIEQWYVDHYDRLVGIVFNHPNFPDGAEVVTSRVVEWNKANNHAETKNTNYILGVPRDASIKLD